ncbi:hypothetical protein LD39_15900 [Halobacillus sp. BBL2006]|nr:hypothetical protein LD39_15900 [Halobacillus sp. BBL2006]
MLLLIQNEKKEILVEQRPSEGLLASLWQFPMVPLADLDEEAVKPWFYGEYGLHIELEKSVDQIKHVFSHLIWEMEVVKAKVVDGDLDRERSRFVNLEEMNDLPFPVSHQKAHKHINQ